MNRFKNKLTSDAEYTAKMEALAIWGDRIPNAGEVYQDLYDQLADDYRGGYYGPRKTKLLLYIEHRAMRDYGVVIHTGTGFSRFDTEDTHHGDPAVIAGLCEDYASYEREEVQEFLAGIR